MTLRRRLTAADRGLMELFRLVQEETWRPVAAAQHLREVIGDPLVLRLMAARVHRAIEDRPSDIATRAALTLAHALGYADEDPLVWQCAIGE